MQPNKTKSYQTEASLLCFQVFSVAPSNQTKMKHIQCCNTSLLKESGRDIGPSFEWHFRSISLLCGQQEGMFMIWWLWRMIRLAWYINLNTIYQDLNLNVLIRGVKPKTGAPQISSFLSSYVHIESYKQVTHGKNPMRESKVIHHFVCDTVLKSTKSKISLKQACFLVWVYFF